MFFYYIFLCISASIDAIGIGISYGIRNSIINNYSKIIISTILFMATFLGVTFGNILSIFLTDIVLKMLASTILILIGSFILIELIKSKENLIKKIDDVEIEKINFKETISLALSVSIDAFGMGMYASILNVNVYFFSLCMTFIHVTFLFLGKFLGKKIINISKIPIKFLKILSGVLLVFIGVLKIFI